MEINFNVDRRFIIFGDKLTSIDTSKNLIIESSYNTIDFSSNIVIFDGHVDLSRLICNNIDFSNVSEISSNFLYVDNINLPTNNKLKYNSVNNGYIGNTRIGINPLTNSIGRSDAFFTYINVSGGDSSFNSNVYINNNLRVDGTLTISNDLLINGINFASVETSFNVYREALEDNFNSAKIITKDLSASAISISNNLYVLKTAYFNDISINGLLLNNVLKVPALFTIDPSGHGNSSGTLIINGDLVVNGIQTSIASSIVDICDQAIMLASRLANIQNLSNTNAGLDISNIASLKYNGTLWNFSGGQLNVQNNKVLFIDDLSLAKRNFDLSLNTFRRDFSSSFFTLKRNIDNSYNATYMRSQIDNSFILRSNFDISLNSLRSYTDSSYISKNTFSISYGDLRTLMDTSYVERRRVGALNSFDSSFNTFTGILDLSYLLRTVFDDSLNKIKTDFDISFATINTNNISTSESAITIETINTKHDSQTFTNNSWNIIGQDFSSIPNNKINNNKNVVISNDGNVVAYSLNDNLSIQQVEQAVQTWTAQTWTQENAGADELNSICWSPQLRRFAAVGRLSIIRTSDNGTNWISRTPPPNSPNWYGVCWSPERMLFVAVGDQGPNRIMNSVNGISWETIEFGDDGRWKSVCWSSEVGIFVAVADNGWSGRVMTSYDGFNWTFRPMEDYHSLTSVCWSPELKIFVAVGSNRILTSINGIDWNIIVLSNNWVSVCWSSQLGIFVAIAGNYPLPNPNQVITSSNGINWTRVSASATTSYQFTSVCWSPQLELFVAVATNSNQALTSIDGINWNFRTVPTTMQPYQICWSPELGIFAVCGGGSQVLTSSLPTTSRAGSVYVYELSYNNWSKLGNNTIVGLSGDELGYSLALSSNGRIVAASSLYKDASAGQVRIFELSNNTNSWIQKGSDINGPRPGSESGYSISLEGSGNSIAIGAWKDNSNGTNAGAVRVYDFSASIKDWRQKGQTITGVSGSFEGYSTALSLDGQTLATGCFSVNNNRSIVNAGQVKIFTILGSTWIPKGIIQGPDISNLYFGRSIKLSGNGNAIVIGAPGYSSEYRITPSYEFISTTKSWQAHRNDALSVYGRDLAVILDASQNAQANALRNNTLAFIGGRRVANPVNRFGKTAADWEWVTGDAWSYENFADSQPDNTNETAVHFWTSEGKWNDINLESNYPAIYMYYKARSLNVGQAYVYGYQGDTTWNQLGQAIVGSSSGDEFGSNVSMSNDGTLISIGSNNNNYNRGQVRVFSYVNNYWYQLSNSINGKTSSSRAGIHALSGDGITLIQSNNTYNSVYGVNRILTFTPSTTSNINTTISGDLIVGGKAYLKSFRISNKHNFNVSINGYSSHYLASTNISASIVDYYSDVVHTYNRVFRIDACGNVSNHSGLYGAVSDSRLKENIVDCGPKLEKLLKIRVVNYNLKGPDKTKYIGVLAQELEELFPELVVEDNTHDRLKSVNYSNLTIMLIKAFQEQQVLINNLAATLKYLESEL
jgi:hypothetical protein